MAMAEYTLMNKNHPVVSFRYDRDIGKVQVHVRDVSASRSVNLEQKRDRILQLPKQQDDISITEETR